MEEESIQILNFFGLITNIEEYQKNIIMPEENINQEISLKKHRWNKKLFNWKNKLTWINKQRAWKSLYSFQLYSLLTFCNFFSNWMCFHFCFCFFSWYSYRKYNFCNWIKTTAGIKTYKSIIKKKKKKHNKIVSLAKSKLSSIEV